MWGLKMKTKLFNKGQSLSTDIVVVVVIVLFGVLFLVMNQINNVKNGETVEEIYDQAAVDSKIVVENLKQDEIINPETNEVDVDKLLLLNEDELREELGIKNDFAIVFEKDGKLVKIDAENNINCVGSNNIIVNGQICSS